MSIAVKNRARGILEKVRPPVKADLAAFIPAKLLPLSNPQTDLPRIAKDD